MKLPFPLTFGKKEKPEYFLALLLRDEKVTAVVFEELQGKVRVLGEHEEYFTTFLESAELEEWLEILDKAISTAETPLPSNIETQKTVFGVKENWVENAKIKKEYLGKIRKMCDSLGLVPIGFLVIHEAIAHYLKIQEGAPVSGILVEAGKRYIAVSLLRAGRIIATKRSKIEDSIPKTTDRILHHFTEYEVLPSRVIVFNGNQKEDIVQDFLGHSWSKSLPFLHVPQIIALEAGFDAKAVISGTAAQMGFEVTVEKDKTPLKTEHESHKPEVSASALEASDTTEPDLSPEVELDNTSRELEDVGAEFGFMMGKDITSLSEEKAEADKQKDSATKANAEESLLKINEVEELEEKEDSTEQNLEDIEEDEEDEELKEEFQGGIAHHKEAVAHSFSNEKKTGIKVVPLVALGKIFMNIKNKLRLPKLGGVRNANKLLFIPPIIILALLSVVILYVVGLKSNVDLEVNPKVVEQNKTITFSTTKSSDQSTGIIAAETVSVSEEGTSSTATTGIKEIGDKAKGTVTLYSRFSQEKNFPSGTIITSSNNVLFVLDDSVKVASVSAADANASTAKVAVTAKQIGKESNLPSGTKFTVGSLDAADIIAKNDSAFSGGNKKEVTVVSKDDLNKLTADLPKNLEQKAKTKLTENASSDVEVLPEFLSWELSKSAFDKKLGEESSAVVLNATVAFKGLSYKKQDLVAFAKETIKESMDNMDLSKKGITYTIENIKKKDDKEATAEVHVKAFLLPKIDTNKATKDIAGKSFSDARTVLKKIPTVSDITISLIPSLPFLPQILPRLPQNINMVITAQ